MSSASKDLTQYSDPGLTQADIRAFEANKKKYFKGTIAVSVIYGVTALALFLLAVFSVRGRELLANDVLPFTVTFIIGVLIVVMLLVISVTTAKPVHVPLTVYDSYKCPDYWTLSKTSKEELDTIRFSNPELVYAYSYRCSPPSSSTKINQPISNSFAPSSQGNMSTNMKGALESMRGLSTTMDSNNKVQVRCNVNYPHYLYLQDVKYGSGLPEPENSNSIRCQVAKSCGYSWTATCPNVPSRDF